MIDKEGNNLQALILRHQQKVFAFVLYLIGGDQDKAYEVTTLSFTEAINRSALSDDENIFLIRVLGIAIEKSRRTKAIPAVVEIDAANLAAEHKKSLRLIQTALAALPFETKALLLLRDQLHVSYRDIAALMDIPEYNVRVQIEGARAGLREKIEKALNGGERA